MYRSDTSAVFLSREALQIVVGPNQKKLAFLGGVSVNCIIDELV